MKWLPLVFCTLLTLTTKAPYSLSMDESFYIQAANDFLTGAHNSNYQHPPLGKLIIALGIKLFGNTTFGWRIMSAVFGSLCLWATYALGEELAGIGIYFMLSTLMGGFLVIHSHVAMLEIFTVTGIVFGHLLAAKLLHAKKYKRHLLYLMGCATGCAISSKWTGLFLLPFAIAFIGLHAITFRRFLDALLALCLIPAIYLASYIPFFIGPYAIDFSEFITMQQDMLHFHDNVMAPHIYMSLPASWLFQLRSIWYACEFDNQGHMQSLCLTGNPIILWLGACLLPLACWKIRNKNVAFLLASYSLYYIPWFFSARETQFLYYYFAPSIFLGGLTGVLLKQKQRTWHLAIASLFFIAYLPFALGFPLRTEYRHYWMWPSGWKWSKDS